MAVDTEYYDVLQVQVDATSDEIRKAYRRMAVRTHPDKNPGDEEAKAKFQAVGEAYQVLNDPQLRERYDKHGKEAAIPDAGFEDPMELVVQIFGGEAFQPWIGELSMFKEMMKMAKAEESEEAGAEGTTSDATATGANAADTTTASAGIPTTSPTEPKAHAQAPAQLHAAPSSLNSGSASTTSNGAPTSPGAGQPSTATSDAHATAAAHSTHASAAAANAAQEKAARLARKEQERKLAEASRESRAQRIDQLTEILANKLSAVTEQWSSKFITSGKASSHDEALLKSFVDQLQLEANELKLESFGLELLHTIGHVYYTRANIFIKSHKSLFGVGGLLSSFKERGSIIKDGWNTLTTAMDAANYIKTLSELEEEALTAEEKAERDQGIMGNVLVALWTGTRFELQGILRQVADNLLYEKGTDSKVRAARARAMFELGKVFKNTTRTAQEAEEVQMFESLVADAMVGKKKHKHKKHAKTKST